MQRLSNDCRLTFFTIAALGCFLLGPEGKTAQRLDATPPGWRAAGSEPLTVNPYSVRPVSKSQSAVRKVKSMKDSLEFDQTKGAVANTQDGALQTVVAPMSVDASSDADYRTPELIALAAGLKNDRDLIFNWVRDNIRYVHYHGCKKGAHLTYLERSGNDMDQSALLIALWRAAGIDCQYVHGLIEMPDTAANNIDWYHYLGVAPSELGQLVYTRGTPGTATHNNFGVYPGHPSNTKVLSRIWTQVNVSGQWYNYDPSFKLIQPEVTNLDLAAAMGYNRTSLLTTLGAGTTTANSVTSLNYSNLNGYLAARVSQFVTTFRTSYLSNTVGQTIGGWKPLSNSTVANNSFPIAAAGYFWGTYATYDVLPDAWYSKIQVQASSVSLNWGPVNMASLRGQRLGLVFNSGIAQLKVEGTQVAQAASAVTSGVPVSLNVNITHAESGDVATGVSVNGTATLGSRGGGSYALIYGFDVTSHYLKARQEQLDRYKEQGLPDTDENMRLETLNVMGLNWLLQTELNHQLVASLKNQSAAYLHRFGRVSHEPTASSGTPPWSLYIDVPMNHSGFVSRVADPGSNNRLVAELTDSFISSAMENGVIEQTQPSVGSNVVSTTRILKLANERGVAVYLGTPTNYYGSVRSQLTGYSASDLSQMDTAVNDGGSVLAPQSGQINLAQWTGSGFAYSVLNASILRQGMIIGGSYSGGFSASSVLIPPSSPLYFQGAASPIRFNTAPVTQPLSLGGDPVDLATGDFTHTRELISAGDGLVRGLKLAVSYHGARRFKNEGKIGYGWTHSYVSKATERTDIEGAYGRATPVEMASSIVGAVIAMDLYANRTGVKDWLATALVSHWMVDQLKGSAVAITAGDRIWQFHKQPDGTYDAPPGATPTLTKNGLGNYELTERHGPTWRFDAVGRLQEVEDLWGKKLSLIYNGNGDVASVQDAYARTLTFTYSGTGGSLSTVTDNSTPQRSVSFNVNASGDLLTFSDAEGKQDKFSYGFAHLILNYNNHNDSAVAANFYDTSGRLTMQYSYGNLTGVWYFYYAPGLTIEKEPNGPQAAETYHYFDDRNREIEVVNAMGHHLITAYDGQNRVTARQRLVGDGLGGWPVNETEHFGYDTSHNLLWQQDAKGHVTSYTYDGANHLSSITDKRNNPQYFQLYNAQHQPTQVTDREGRVTTLTYKPSTDPGAGAVATSTEGGFTTSYNYDSKGALNQTIYPGGASESRVNNFLGDPETIVDTLSRQTTKTYNKRREITSITSPGTTTSGTRTAITTYDNARNVGSVQNPRGNTTSYLYGGTRKLIYTTLPGGALITNHYNTRDQLDWTSNPLSQINYTSYDALGRAISLTDPLNRTTTTIFQDSLRKTISQSAAPFNYQEKLTVDERGQAIRDENALGHYAVPGYDNNGNETTWQDRRGKLWQRTFDKENRQLTVQSPMSRTITQVWNTRGLLGSVQEPSGQTTTFSYDGRRRLTSKSDLAGSITYGLDAASQLTTVTEGAAVLTRTFHGSGQVATYTNANNETIAYDYDKNGNLVSLTYPAVGGLPTQTVTYGYDNRDRLISITDWTNRVTTLSWDAAGRLTEVVRPNSTKRTLQYDAAGQILAIGERLATGEALQARAFQYDSVGRIEKRLTYPETYLWSEPAFRKEASWTASYDDDNRVTTLGATALTSDSDGNLLTGPLPDGYWGEWMSMGANGTFTWNARNQLVRVVRNDNGLQVDYSYDAEGNLVSQTDSLRGTTRWIVDPNGGPQSRVLAKVAPNGSVTRYIYGKGLLYEVRGDGSVRYYHYDQVGSTIGCSDANGAPTGLAFYSPYGALLGATGEMSGIDSRTPFLFAGEQGVITDSATGLHNMRARWYSSHLRRFMSQDPIGLAGGENIYAYADGNPLMLTDPLGLATWSQIVGLGKAVGGIFEFAAGASLGIATSWTGVGAVAGGIVALHGLDTIQSGIRQAITGRTVDSFTSMGLQAAGMSRNGANITDAGISVVGSVGTGVFNAATKVAAIAATPEAAGMSTWQILRAVDSGSKALPGQVYGQLGGQATSAIEKATMMAQGTIQGTSGINLLQATRLAPTGLTPLADLGAGASGAILTGTAGWFNYKPSASFK